MKRLNVLLVDDNPLARQAVTSLLQEDGGYDIVGEASDGLTALSLAHRLMPDLILMDINMPNCDGLLATRLIKRELPHVMVVILTVSDDAADLFEALKAGAQGYLMKHMAPADWLEYLRSLVQGDSAISRPFAERILSEFSRSSSSFEPDLRLTEREQEVLRLVAAAMTNKQVAVTLHISDQTVKNHIKNIMQKLHLQSRVELALHAQKLTMKHRQQNSPIG